MLVFLFPMTSLATSPPGDPEALNIERISSLDELKHVLDVMHTRLSGVEESHQRAFELQKTVATQSGECISRIVDLSQKADLSKDNEKEAFKAVFMRNGALLRRMVSYNQAWMDDMLEERLDRIQDKDAFFASPEWMEPQYLLAITSYWLGWNNYYAALLYRPDEKARRDLLDEALSAFTRTMPDLKEEDVLFRCMLGRALCFKERGKYDRALQDISSLMAKVPRNNPLYAQAGYERALITHLSGEHEQAKEQIHLLRSELKPDVLTPQIQEKLKDLEISIVLETAERKSSGRNVPAGESYRDSVRELRSIAMSDPGQAGVLYQYVFEHAEQLSALTDAELGSMGSMAIADRYFERKQYEAAGDRYRRIHAAPDLLINKLMDGICFRLAYCYAQQQQWQEALPLLEELFGKYPGSTFAGTAACLYHVVAARAYQSSTSENAYERYIKAAECYVKKCADEQDKSEAHYQLGRYYQNRDRAKDALRELLQVGSDSSHYHEARHTALLLQLAMLQSKVETLEALSRDNRGQSDEAQKLYREGVKQAGDYAARYTKDGTPPVDSEGEGQLALLLARLYVHGPLPDVRKSLGILEGFDKKHSTMKQGKLVYPLVRRLKIACCLKLGMLAEAGREIAAITAQGIPDSATWAFLTETADRYYAQAKEAHTQGPADASAGKYAETALAVYTRLGDIAARDAAYKNFYEPIQMRRGELYTIDHKIAEAAAIYREMLADDPSSADALYNLAVIYEREEKWEDAFSSWNKLARGLKAGSTHWLEARYRSASALIRLGKHNDACEVIAVTLSRYPANEHEEMKGNYLQLQDDYCAKTDPSTMPHE